MKTHELSVEHQSTKPNFDFSLYSSSEAEM